MLDFLTPILGTDSLIVGTLIPFLIVLTVVVFVHEMGHYLVGRWCGIGVNAFSIGFGPELIGFNDRHGTRWKLCAIPLGGYVKFVGDMNATSTPVAEEIDKLSVQEQRVAFHTQPVWKRALTVLAGPMFNFMLTIAVFAVFFAVYGRMVAEPMVAEVRADSPAAAAGFEPGDRFVSVNGNRVETFSDVQRLVSGRTGDPLTFKMLRDDREVELHATPELMEQEDALGNKIKVGVIGVVNSAELGQPRVIEYSVPGALGEAVVQTGYQLERTWSFLARFASGREDKCQLGGPVKIAQMSGQAAKVGFEVVVQLIAALSLGIGFLNLLPIPPLDGGHLVFYAVEAVIGRPVSERAMEMVYRIGFALVLGFMGFVFWNDLFGC
ncbi:RIP metalloprotease RseP [Mesorhizobium sp. NBSH29]|uniref:RIP metalloprotease RseP n=1 Tax=Mesorhizobium sp. NBSH29 TaxID=2654249 RepID=UPI0018966BF5|nr:RIP metalloprotease RseP [Mesorhizobium sp. NBSH29]QPC87690.1 RIP metalloprotease RseP [Mesorhizobium sp. NBSH29]